MVNKAEIDVFLELSCFFHDPADVGNLISGSSAFSKASLNIWKFVVHILLKPGLENFEDYFTSMWDKYNCVVVWAFFGIAFLWDWNENWSFLVLWPLLSFSNLLMYSMQHLRASSYFRIWNSSTGIPDRMWSLEKGMANHFSILALRTPWTVWKGKMIGYWKRNSPGQ